MRRLLPLLSTTAPRFLSLPNVQPEDTLVNVWKVQPQGEGSKAAELALAVPSSPVHVAATTTQSPAELRVLALDDKATVHIFQAELDGPSGQYTKPLEPASTVRLSTGKSARSGEGRGEMRETWVD